MGRKHSDFSGFFSTSVRKKPFTAASSSFRMLAEKPHIFMDTSVSRGSDVQVAPSSSVKAAPSAVLTILVRSAISFR